MQNARVDGQSSKGRILVIDDNRQSADSYQSLLQIYGYEVDVAYCGNTGLQAALDNPPQLILCDIRLPGLDGFELVRRLRESEATRDIPAIAISAYGRDLRLKALASGFTGHLVKPVDPVLLRSVVGGFDLERHD